MRRLLGILCCWSCTLIGAAGGSDPGEAVAPLPLLVLNRETNTPQSKAGSITFLDAERYEVLGGVDVGVNPSLEAVDSGMKHLYVLNHGKRALSGKPKEEASLAIVDFSTRKVVATIEVGVGPLGVLLSDKTPRLYVFARGREGERSVLTVVDRENNQKLGAVETGVGGSAIAESPSGRWLYLLHAGDAKDPRAAPPRLLVFDAQDMKTVQETDLASLPLDILRSPDGKLFYILCGGGTGKRRNTKVEGKVYVLDSEAHQVLVTLEVGFDPRSTYLDSESGRLYVASRAEPGSGGALFAIRGAEVLGRIPLEEEPWRIEPVPSSRALVVLGEETVALVDPDGMKRVHQFTLPAGPSDIALSPDGGRAYVGATSGSWLTALNLQSGSALTSLKTGRKGVRAAKIIGAAIAAVPVGPPGVRWIAVPPSAVTQNALRPDAMFVYALNMRSDDVTIIDARKLSVMGTIPVGTPSYSMRPAPDGQHLYVLAARQLTVIDTRSNATSTILPFNYPLLPTQTDISFDAARDSVFVPDPRGISVLGLSTGRRKSYIPDLLHPERVVLPSDLQSGGKRALP